MTMRTTWLRAFAAFALAFATAAQAQLYGVNPFSNSVGVLGQYGLFHLDPTTGGITDARIITLPGFTVTGANALTRDPTTGLVYTVLKVSAVAGRVLATVNVASGVATQVGNLGDNFATLAFRADGQLFGVTGDGASVPETLYLIDKASAATTIASALGNGADGEVIAYNPNDNSFYHWSGNGTIVFERIDANSYVITPISSGSANGEIFGAVWDPAAGAFLTHNIGSRMEEWTTTGVNGNLQAATVADVRGMAFVPAPTVVSIVRVGANPTNAASVDFTVTFSEAMTGVDVTDFVAVVTGATTGTIASVSGSGTTWTVTVNTISGDGTLRIDLVDDDTILSASNALGGPGAGNGNFTPGEAYTFDFTAPVVTVVAVPANATYVGGNVLTFTVTLDEATIVTGAPSIPVTIGAVVRNATYVSGSGTTNLVFSYTVQPGELDTDGIALGAAIALNGGTLRDAAGNNAVLTLNGVPSTAGILVDATGPTVTTVAVPANGTYVTGNVLAFTVNFDEAVVVNTAGGTPSIPVTVGAIVRNAAYVSGSGTASLVFSYTVQVGDVDLDGIALGAAIAPNGGTLRDASANNANLALNGVPSTAGILVNVPVVVKTYSAPSATGSGTITATFTGGGAGCTYAVSQFIPVTGHPASPPAGSAPAVSFPHGLFDFRLTGCTPGSTITMTITYPAALPAGTQYWKYGPTPANATPHWYILTAAIAGNTAVFSITDGSTGDDDLTANGTIVDQGGPGVPAGGGPIETPTMSQWMLMLLASLMLAMGMWGRRRPR